MIGHKFLSVEKAITILSELHIVFIRKELIPDASKNYIGRPRITYNSWPNICFVSIYYLWTDRSIFEIN